MTKKEKEDKNMGLFIVVALLGAAMTIIENVDEKKVEKKEKKAA